MTTTERMANSNALNTKLSDFKHNDNATIDINEDKIVPYNTILSFSMKRFLPKLTKRMDNISINRLTNPKRYGMNGIRDSPKFKLEQVNDKMNTIAP